MYRNNRKKNLVYIAKVSSDTFAMFAIIPIFVIMLRT